MSQPHPHVQAGGSPDYRDLTDRMIQGRVRIVAGLGAFLMGLFGFLDYAVYPDHVEQFLKIRLAVCLFYGLVCAVTFNPAGVRASVWLCDGLGLAAAAGIAAMIGLADGTRSDYYQGLSIVVIAVTVMNGVRFWHNAAVCFLIWVLYTAACTASPQHWQWVGYVTGSFFLVTTMVFMLVMTRLFSREHLSNFESSRKLHRMFSEADTLAKLDDLTKVWNRRFFMELLEEKILQCRESRTSFFLVFFDIDNFKGINDRHGHAFGDEVIRAVVDCVQNRIRSTSRIGRYGGDEFMFFMDTPDTGSFMNRMREVRDGVREIRLQDGAQQVRVSVSFGAVRVAPGRYASAAELTDATDRAMLSVKQSGKGELFLLDS